MQAPLRRQTRMIGAKWLRNGNSDGRNSSAGEGETKMVTVR